MALSRPRFAVVAIVVPGSPLAAVRLSTPAWDAGANPCSPRPARRPRLGCRCSPWWLQVLPAPAPARAVALAACPLAATCCCRRCRCRRRLLRCSPAPLQGPQRPVSPYPAARASGCSHIRSACRRTRAIAGGLRGGYGPAVAYMQCQTQGLPARAISVSCMCASPGEAACGQLQCVWLRKRERPASRVAVPIDELEASLRPPCSRPPAPWSAATVCSSAGGLWFRCCAV